MDSDAIDRHVAAIRQLSKPGGPLSPDAPTASTRNPEWFVDGLSAFPRRERAQFHLDLVRPYLDTAARLPEAKEAVVLAGPPGAGKSDLRDKTLAERGGEMIVVDADDFKAALLERALDDGSIESWFTSADLREHENQIGQLYPMELAALVHEESSMLAKVARAQLIDAGAPLVIDAVLGGDVDRCRELGSTLATAGYSVEVIDVEVPKEISEERIRSRHRASYEDALAGRNPLGGRWVPSDYMHSVFGDGDRASSQRNASTLSSEFGNVMRHRRYWTPATGQRAGQRTKEEDLSRAEAGAPLRPTAMVTARNKGARGRGPAAGPPAAAPTMEPRPGGPEL